jgi:short-subunit dehydrogenase involved in D-alanine esterification of teichoic acids
MNISFKNKLVLITGGNSGIGRAITDKFIELGAKVIVTTTNIKKLKKSHYKLYKYLDFNIPSSISDFLYELLLKISRLINMQ